MPQINTLLNHLASIVLQKLDDKVSFLMGFLGFSHRLSVCVKNYSLDLAIIHRAVTIASDSLVATLQDSLANPNEELQVLICRWLNELHALSVKSPIISAAFLNHVVPFLQKFLASGRQITEYVADLQVI